MYDLEVIESAYKHGYSYEDIINCYRFPIKTMVLKEDKMKYLYIGFDTKSNPMEILANHNGKTTIFHAMKLRKVFEKLLK